MKAAQAVELTNNLDLADTDRAAVVSCDTLCWLPVARGFRAHDWPHLPQRALQSDFPVLSRNINYQQRA